MTEQNMTSYERSMLDCLTGLHEASSALFESGNHPGIISLASGVNAIDVALAMFIDHDNSITLEACNERIELMLENMRDRVEQTYSEMMTLIAARGDGE